MIEWELPHKPIFDNVVASLHLDGREAATHALEFAFAPGARTCLTLTSLPSNAYALGMHPEDTRNRFAQLDRLAAWLAERGGGRVLETGWGKP